jgi:hypothetical protein
LPCPSSSSAAPAKKNKPIAQRGWIGGQYALARPSGFLAAISASPGVVGTLPKTLRHSQKAAILVTQLATNAPAELAGLRKGDFVLELNHRPMTSLQKFRRTIDHSEPGTLLALKAWRNGQVMEYNVPVGCEKFKSGGWLGICLPTVVHCWDLWPNPGFSLVVLGYEPNPGVRRELDCDRPAHEVYDEEWSAYLGFLEISCGKRIVAQKPVTPGKG